MLVLVVGVGGCAWGARVSLSVCLISDVCSDRHSSEASQSERTAVMSSQGEDTDKHILPVGKKTLHIHSKHNFFLLSCSSAAVHFQTRKVVS